jgi:isoquinoline 1-oxidoreductase beta subunit
VNARFLPLPIIENVSRRGFLQGTLSAGALVVAMQFPTWRRAEAYETGAGGMPNGTVNDPHVFVSIAPDGTVTIVRHRSEMGTGASTGVPMVLADEMGADWARVRLVQAPGDEPRYGNQDTDGSRSMRHYIQPMRQCGAAMRQMLEAAAAKQWGVPVGEVAAGVHEVVHQGSGRKLGYGELAQAAMAMPTPPVDQLKLKDPSAFRYMGKGDVPMYDLHDITTGKAVYGSDVRLPGMRYAVIAHPPVVGGKVKSFDAAEAMKVPGVEKVVEIPGSAPPAKFAPLGGVAVVASNSWAAIKGREALKIVWDDGPHAVYDSATYRTGMEEASRKPGKVVRNEGDAEKALASAAKVVTAEYYQPHLAHAPMETPNAVAVVTGDKCEVWSSVQSPYGTREDLAKLLGMPIDNVRVNVTLLGGGFGRKSKCDFAQEAALLSKGMGGYAGQGAVDPRGRRPERLLPHHLGRAARGLGSTRTARSRRGGTAAWRRPSSRPSCRTRSTRPRSSSRWASSTRPFDVPNVRCENGEAPAHVRIGWFRSVSNVPRAFAVQSFVAELAAAAGKDPKDFLLELIGPARKVDIEAAGLSDKYWNYGEPLETYPIDTGRLANVVRLAAEKAEWGRKLPPRHGLGIAVHRSFVTYVATGGRGRGLRGRQGLGAQGRDGGRLRLPGQPGAHPLADGRCGRHGHDPRHVRRGLVQERPRRAEQLPRLRDGAHGQLAAPGEHAHRPERVRGAGQRHRRAGAAALRAGALQRDLRGHRQARARPADREGGPEVDLSGSRPAGDPVRRPAHNR